MNWTEQHDNAKKAVAAWFKDKSKKQVFRLFGYAGSGKTTLAKEFAQDVGSSAFCAFTGKAALVLRSKGCVGSSTIHSLIYKTNISDDGIPSFSLNKNSIIRDVDLIIVDECSMVGTDMGEDLKSFKKPILVLGDPAQLPPVEGAGYFTNHPPDVMLTEIHRQSKDNPIVYLATELRNKRKLKLGDYGNSKVTNKLSLDCFGEKDQVLVGKNDTRRLMNIRARKFLEYDDEDPLLGERVICLQNDSSIGIYNGGTFEIVEKFNHKSPYFYKLGVRDDFSKNVAGKLVNVHKSFFRPEFPTPGWKILKGTQQFDYAYAITGHKSQGSQWDSVLVYDESYVFGQDWWRWAYTCVTRAAENVEFVMKD